MWLIANDAQSRSDAQYPPSALQSQKKTLGKTSESILVALLAVNVMGSAPVVPNCPSDLNGIQNTQTGRVCQASDKINTFYVQYSAGLLFTVGLVGFSLGKIGDVDSSAYSDIQYLCKDNLLYDTSSNPPAVEALNTVPIKSGCQGVFDSIWWDLNYSNCGDSTKTVSLKYTFQYGGKLEFYLVIYPEAEKLTEISSGVTFESMRNSFDCDPPPNISPPLDCNTWSLDPGQTWLSGDLTCDTFSAGTTLVQNGLGVKYKIAGTSFDTSINPEAACGTHTILDISTSWISPFTINTSGQLLLDQPSTYWPSKSTGAKVTYSVKVQVKLSKSIVAAEQTFTFDATTPCNCASIKPATILNYSDTVTLYKQYLPKIYYGTDVFTSGWLNHMKACWGPEYVITFHNLPVEFYRYGRFSASKTGDVWLKVTDSVGYEPEISFIIQVKFSSSAADQDSKIFSKEFKFNLTYQVRSVMDTGSIGQPTLTANDPIDIQVAISSDGKGLPTSADNISVRYDIIAPLPVAVTPAPYTGYTGSHSQLETAPIGTTHLLNNEGYLTNTYSGVIQAGETLKVDCNAWSTQNQGTSETLTSQKFTNSMHSSYMGTFDYKCSYQAMQYAKFASQPEAIEIKYGAQNSYPLPAIIKGNTDFKEIQFTPDPLIQDFLTIDQPTSANSLSDASITYNGSRDILKLNGQKQSLELRLVLIDQYDQSSGEYTVIVTIACPINPDSFAQIHTALQTQTILIEAESQKDTTTTSSMQAFYDLILQQLGYSKKIETDCDVLTTSLLTPHADFLSYDNTTLTLTMISTKSTMQASYQDSYFQAHFMQQNLQVAINATFTACQLTKLGFERPSFSFKYDIGSEMMYIQLPQVVQEPSCGKVFDSYSVNKVNAPQQTSKQIEEAVNFDKKTNRIQVQTDDYSLAKAVAKFQIQIDQSEISTAEDFVAMIEFSAPLPEFNMTAFKVSPITCSSQDEQWVMKLPAIITQDISPVVVKLEPIGSYAQDFEMIQNTVVLVNSAIDKFQNGSCPTLQEIELKFILQSTLLGDNEQILKIPVKSSARKKEEILGVEIETNEEELNEIEMTIAKTLKEQVDSSYVPQHKQEPLRIKEMSLTPEGQLTISFNKAIKPLPFQSQEAESQGKKRRTQSTSGDYEIPIQDAIQLRIEDSDEELDKSIAQVEFVGQDSDSFTAQITFQNTKAISPEITYPDNLVMTIALPWLFVDQDSGKNIQPGALSFKTPVSKQYTKAEYAELVEQAESAARIGVAVCIWEIALILLFKKVLFSMWVLILTLQFYVYIATWQVRYPSTLQFLLYELKRVALGEFIEDLDFGNQVREFFGFEKEQSSGQNEKVGQERLGSTNALSSIGPTLILVSLFFLVLILLMVILIFIRQKIAISEKFRNRVESLKPKVFYNPIFRYFILNIMKLNMGAIVALKAAGKEASLFVTPSLMLLVITSIPIIFACLIYRQRDQLDEQKTRKSIGSIYDGKNVAREDHKAFLYPMLFFWRRTFFIIVTVLLFDYPALQMKAHLVLTMLSTALLIQDRNAFDSQAQRAVEVGSEFLLLFSSTILCLFTNSEYSQDQQEQLQSLTLAVFSLLLLLNMSFVVYTLFTSYREKKRKKILEQRRKTYEDKIKDQYMAEQYIADMKASIDEEQKQLQVKPDNKYLILKLESIQEENESSFISEPSWKKAKAIKREKRIMAKKLAMQEKKMAEGMNQSAQEQSMYPKEASKQKDSSLFTISDQSVLNNRSKLSDSSSLFVSDPSLLDEDPSASQFNMVGPKDLTYMKTRDISAFSKVLSPTVDDLMLQFESIAKKQDIDIPHREPTHDQTSSSQHRYMNFGQDERDFRDIQDRFYNVEAILRRKVNKH